MKKTAILLTLILIGLAGFSQAQTARQLYLGYENTDKLAPLPPKVKGKPGAKVVIERSRNGKLEFVSPNAIFRSGDKIRLRFATNFDGYLAIINVGSTGNVNLLFPYVGADARISQSKDFQVPQRDWIVFDDNPGTETLTIIMARSPLGLSANSDLRKLNKDVTGGRDLFVESTNDATYAVATPNALDKPIGFILRLKHGK